MMVFVTGEVCSPPLTPPTFKIFKTLNVIKYKRNRETIGKIHGNDMIGSLIGNDI